jgi:hypothetical protein
VHSTSRYVAVLAAALAALAIGCAEPTSPHQGTACSGGGTGTWDITCSTTTATKPATSTDTAIVAKP